MWSEHSLFGSCRRWTAKYFFIADLDFEYTTPWLAESWERPDRLTYVLKIRKGVHYHEPDTPGGKLVGGREMNAKDVAYSFQRMLGIGKFEGKDPNPNVPEWKGTVVKSITATDDWTVEFKFIKNMPTFLTQVWRPWHGTQINPLEILEKWGNFVSWEHVVGTGPYMIKEYASGSHITYVKNPNYWAMDPVFPGYKLPYADEIKGIIIEDAGTRLAAFRTGQVDWIREIPSKDAPAIIEKNPEVKYLNVLGAPGMHLAMNQKDPPFEKLKVRKALQMSIDRETIAKGYFKGFASTQIHGIYDGYRLPWIESYDEWPDEELKAEYTYNPERAKKLLDEAGLPVGSDGFRFKAIYELAPTWYGMDPGYARVIKSYFAEVGVDLEIKTLSQNELIDNMKNGSSHISWGQRGYGGSAPDWACLAGPGSKSPTDSVSANDAHFDDLCESVAEADTLEEQRRLAREADFYVLKNNWVISSVTPQNVRMWWPWLGGANGEYMLQARPAFDVLSRYWIYKDMKKEMGHYK